MENLVWSHPYREQTTDGDFLKCHHMVKFHMMEVIL